MSPIYTINTHPSGLIIHHTPSLLVHTSSLNSEFDYQLLLSLTLGYQIQPPHLTSCTSARMRRARLSLSRQVNGCFSIRPGNPSGQWLPGRLAIGVMSATKCTYHTWAQSTRADYVNPNCKPRHLQQCELTSLSFEELYIQIS